MAKIKLNSRLILVGLAMVTALVGTAYSLVTASELEVWTASGEIKKELIAANISGGNDQKYCIVEEKYEIFYRVTWPVKAFSNKFPVKTCWYKTNVGEVGMSGGRIYITSPDGDSVIRSNFESYNTFYPLGDNNKLAMTASNGTSFFRNLYIYDNFQSRLTRTTSSNVEFWNIDLQNAWRLNGTNGTGLSINHMDQSRNGNWLVVEGGSGFMRINTQTKEILTFAPQNFGYGSGLNPTYELTISDSGRYAVVSGGNLYARDTHVYDLNTCIPVNGAPLQIATGCARKDLKTTVFPELAANEALSNIIFSQDETTMNLAVRSNRYAIAAPGFDVYGMEYLALGDSYTSGEGEYDGQRYYMPGTDGNGGMLSPWNTGLTNFPYKNEKCHLSTRSYPYAMALNAGLDNNQFKSVACSGSTTNDIVNTSDLYLGRFDQYDIKDYLKNEIRSSKDYSTRDFIPGRAAQIEFVKKYKPRIATIGIGGNDLGFSSKIKDCSIPVLDTCSWANELRYVAAKDAQTNLYAKLNETYSQLKQASSSTQFIAVGYPNIISDNDDICAPNIWLNKSERDFARQYVRYINQVIKAAATKNQIEYVDVEESLIGDRLCDASYDGKAVQGLAYGKDFSIPIPIFTPFGTKWTYVGVGNESYHPTHIGHERIASAISNEIAPSNIANYKSCPSLVYASCFTAVASAPTLPPYFTSYSNTAVDVAKTVDFIESAYVVDDRAGLGRGTGTPLSEIYDSSGEKAALAPNQSVSVKMYSTPRQVGTITIDNNGSVQGSVTIPSDVEPGPHTLVIEAKDSLYQNVLLYQSIFVYDTLEDFDGDGILNTDEKCGMVNPINQDEDRDGIDDACDGIIDIKSDTTAPTVTAQLSQQPNNNGWHKENVTITWYVSDDTDTELGAPVKVIADREGEHTYSSSEVCDAAGNCATGSVTIKLDKTRPTIDSSIAETPTENGWFNRDVTIDWAASDNLSVVTDPMNTIANLEGDHEYSSTTVCDQAGNCSVGISSVKIDKTAPLLAPLQFSKNPKSVGESSQLTANITEITSNIYDAEYFIGEDPGLGNGAALQFDTSTASTIFGTSFGTGVYKISMRVQDAAGNWSQVQSDYLVVYDATSGVRLRGARSIDLVSIDNQLPWINDSRVGQGKFAFSIRYGVDGAVTPQSDFQFAYKTGLNCNNPSKAVDCHSFELNASQIQWLTTTGSNQETGIFRGSGILKTDTSAKLVSFVVTARDGERLSPISSDIFDLTVYSQDQSLGSTPLYFVTPTEVGRGNIKIKF